MQALVVLCVPSIVFAMDGSSWVRHVACTWESTARAPTRSASPTATPRSAGLLKKARSFLHFCTPP